MLSDLGMIEPVWALWFTAIAQNVIFTKTDTGDESNPFEGMKVSNTFDNTYKIYLDGGWRTIASW